MEKNYLIINLKQYIDTVERKEELKDAILKLREVANSKNVEIIVVPQYLDANFYAWHQIKTYVQHVNYYEEGRGTGYVLPETLVSNGIKGTILNHSEHRLDYETIKKTVSRVKKLDLEICLCAENSCEVKKFNNLDVDFIAVEPPELIGGDVSVSKAEPVIIKDSVRNAGDKKLLVGAGVRNQEDVRIALELGAKGVLVASGIAKASNFYEAILELLEGF